MKEKETDDKLLQWHPAFYASIQIELSEEADKLIFEQEHNLGTKPMLIDVLVIKKNQEVPIRKNLGRIFRKYNIIEYKSPKDYLSVDDFYKVYGYCYFYKSQAEKQNEIKVEELTITFICSHYPRKFIKHLKSKRKLEEYNGELIMIAKKVKTVVMFILTCAMFLCACGKDESGMMTGYLDGEVQKEYVMVHNALYCYEGKTQESLEQIEEKGYVKVGEVSVCDNLKIPETNFTAAHVDEGTISYSSEKDDEYIYLEMEDKELVVFQKQE